MNDKPFFFPQHKPIRHTTYHEFTTRVIVGHGKTPPRWGLTFSHDTIINGVRLLGGPHFTPNGDDVWLTLGPRTQLAVHTLGPEWFKLMCGLQFAGDDFTKWPMASAPDVELAVHGIYIRKEIPNE